MMKTTEIILIAAAFSVLGVRLYKKYTDAGKNRGNKNDIKKEKENDDDGYEPYMNK